jgi:hypothetical protein
MADLLREECLISALEENFADDPYDTACFVIKNMLTRCMEAGKFVDQPFLETLGQAMVEPEVTELYEALKPFLTPAQHRELAEMLDLCPVHGCDIQICRDDNDTCQ